MITKLIGMNRTDGQLINDYDHIKQSINDILTTPLGSRVMRRDYGSLLSELIDRPLSDQLILTLYSVVVTAIMKFEPRVALSFIAASRGDTGLLLLTLHWDRITDDSVSREIVEFEFEVL